MQVYDRSVSSRVLDVVVHAILLVVLVLALFPILHVVAMSVSEAEAIVRNTVGIIPQGFQLEGYRVIIEAGRVPRAFRNSILYTSVGTAINLVLTLMMAYPLSKKRLTFRGLYTILAVITLYFAGGLIPMFILVRSLGMYNTMWALVVPTGISVFNMIIMRTFFQGLPQELEESAFLDGANDVVVLLRIAIPLSKAMLATIGLFYAVSHWNSYLPAIIYLRSSAKYPLQVIVHEIVTRFELSQELAQFQAAGPGAALQSEEFMAQENVAKSEMIKYATLVASILPMLVVYPFVQRYFTKGLMIGSIRG
jgi:putative aldouronate transport system permease protein